MSKYVEMSFRGAFDYLISYPEDFNENKKYPVLMFLHGAGTRGPEMSVLENNGNWKRLCEKVGEQAIVVAPHCVVIDWNEIMSHIIAFCEEIRSYAFVDTTRFYLTGNSMGGYGTWELSILRPEFFAAVVPVCGGGMSWNAKRLVDTPVWAFHGMLDPTVPFTDSVNMVNGVNKAGGNARLTVYENLLHNCWTTCYEESELYEWLFAQQKTEARELEETIKGEIYG